MSNRNSSFACRALLAGLAVTIISMSGCSICCGPYDRDYPVYGGRFERTDPSHGRIGSVFSDPYVVIGESADSNLTPHEQDTEREDGEFFSYPEDETPYNDETLPNPNTTPEPEDPETALRNWRGRQLRNADTWR